MLLQELSRSRLFDTLREIERLQGRFNQMFNSPYRTSGEFPPINAWTSEDAAYVTAEIPGIDTADIEITVVNDTLTIRGTRKPEELNEGDSLHRRERGYGQFARTIQLPFKVEAEKVEAINKKGILCITLPRAEQDKPRKIEVCIN